ncbi:MAG TPA: ABC transporter ATP-binding protein [Anaerolineaceae bacterium]|mgnify:CR=1 FL=1|nr:ABC transporter ATP-binding protein [Longilinea sp.]HNZ13351.1 ABC transporter ATP-binding protein [Anaerolineaceae bacterium]HOG78369.1 ABC transporter ATP-binding protein [Anaerolineaceae bacterium]HQF61391.1 ABC transporter ATP-binding protein [Anaerolineaceae bacterium]HQH85175.1 ABC transporter ATP-binding protein [Anaerolineaceae bacterium]
MRLDVQSLVVRYGLRVALNGVSFSLNSGEVLAVIGPNGAGKTSLLRALSGIQPAESGQMLLDGRDVAKLSPVERARWMAVVPQARQLPALFTGYQTVMLGRTPHINWLGRTLPQDEAAVHQAMQRTGTLELAERRVDELSGGEQQRLLLARALAQGSPLLLLDEPTTHLDLHYQISLMDNIRSLAHDDGLAVLLVTHDLHLVARYSNRVALLVGGELLSQGTPQEVLTPDLLSRAYQIPAEAVNLAALGL